MSYLRQEKCDVLILSANLGTGHYQVSNSIKSSLINERSDLKIAIHDSFDHVDPLIKHLVRFSYEQSLKHFTYGYQWFYEATRNLNHDSKFHQTIHAIGRQRLLQTIKRLTPRVIVCTFPYPVGAVSAITTVENICIPVISVITDVAVHSQWIHPKVDAYLVATDDVAKGLVRMNVPTEKVHVTGIPLRHGFECQSSYGELQKKLNLNPDLITLMVMGGGGGLLSGVENILSKLSISSLPVQVLAVSGTNHTMYSKLQKLSSTSLKPIRVFGYVENIADLMGASDILLTKAGGVTIFEALAKNLPMILYNPLPGHESGNVKFLLSHYCALLANSEDSALDHIKNIVTDPSMLNAMKKSIRTVSKPNASKDAASIILKYLDLNPTFNAIFSKPKHSRFALKRNHSTKLKQG